MENKNIFILSVAGILIVAAILITILVTLAGKSDDISLYTELPSEEDISKEAQLKELQKNRIERVAEIQTVISKYEREMISLIGSYRQELDVSDLNQPQYNIADSEPGQTEDLTDLINTDSCDALIDSAKDDIKTQKNEEEDAEDDVAEQDREIAKIQERLNQAIASNATLATKDAIKNELENAEGERDDRRQDQSDAERERELAENKLDEIEDRCRAELRAKLFAKITKINDLETCRDAIADAQQERDDADDDVDDAEEDQRDEEEDLDLAESRLQDARDAYALAVQMNATREEIDNRLRDVDFKLDAVEDAEDDVRSAEDRLDEQKQEFDDIVDFFTELRDKCRRFV